MTSRPAGDVAQVASFMKCLVAALTSSGLVLVSLSCGGGSGGSGAGSNSPPPITVSLSPSSTVSALLGGTVQFSASVTGTSNTAVTWTVNNIAGGNATVGIISSAGIYMAPQDLPNPASATVTATSQADSTKSASVTVTITSDITINLQSSPTGGSVQTGGTLQLSATVNSSGNPDKTVTWSVNGIQNGNATVGTVNATGTGTATYTAPASVPSPANVTIQSTSVADPGKSAALSVTISAPPVQISVSPSSVSVATSTTQQFTATVSGSSNTAVAWSVNGVAGGNSSVGTISASGLYTAPAIVPTPYTVTVQATSAADSSTTASASAIIVGTIESTSQFISSADGGTVTLPSGSSVTIPPGALPSDQSVTLSLVSALPNQPPNTSIAGVGPALILSFPDKVTALPTASGTMDFLIQVGANATDSLQGATPMVGIGDPPPFTYLGASGAFDPATATATLHVPVRFLQNTDSAAASLANLTPNATSNPPTLGPLAWTGSNWVPWSPGASTGKVLVLVHGMASTVQQAFSDSNGMPCVENLRMAGQYDDVVGFNYDWTQDLNASGQALAQFLDQLAQSGATEIDFAAHSEGGPVKDSALVQAAPATQALFGNSMCFGCANDGTPVGTAGFAVQQGLATTLLNYPPGLFSVPSGVSSFQGLLTGQFAGELSQGSSALSQIQQGADQLLSKMQHVVLVAGEPPLQGTFFNVLDRVFFQAFPSDGVIGLDSSLYLKYPHTNAIRILAPGLNHTQLTCDQTVIADVAAALNSPPPPIAGNYVGTFYVTQVTDLGGGGCPSTANMQASATMKLAASSTIQGGFDFTGDLTIVQGPGLCDDYSGDYPFSGSIDANGNTSFSAGPGTAVGTFRSGFLQGTWNFSAGPGPDVGGGNFLLVRSIP